MFKPLNVNVVNDICRVQADVLTHVCTRCLRKNKMVINIILLLIGFIIILFALHFRRINILLKKNKNWLTRFFFFQIQLKVVFRVLLSTQFFKSCLYPIRKRNDEDHVPWYFLTNHFNLGLWHVIIWTIKFVRKIWNLFVNIPV